MSAEPLPRVSLAAGKGVPLDRGFALARPGAAFDPEHPAGLPKTNFVMLMSDERLAELRVAYDDHAARLTIDPATGARSTRIFERMSGARRSSCFTRGSWVSNCAAGRVWSARRGTCSPTTPQNTSR
jgi:hypothetical protein